LHSHRLANGSSVELEKGVPSHGEKVPRHGASVMTNKTTAPHDTKKQTKVPHPDMMGDGTEEQNLGERGNPAARIED
jgi:hypothetical protein